MKSTRVLALVVTLTYALCLAAEDYSDKALYANYLSGKMTLWSKYLAHTDKIELSDEELARAVNYDYGYIAWLIDEKRRDEATKRLEIYERRINQLAETDDVDMADIYVYRASVAAFKWLMNKIKLNYARKAIEYTEKAMEENSSNPRALSLLGNAQFNNPFGSNKDAAKTLLRSIEMFEKYGENVNSWGYTATRLSLVQCYEKLGQKDKAINYAEKILSDSPDFVYLRDVYLPALKEK